MLNGTNSKLTKRRIVAIISMVILLISFAIVIPILTRTHTCPSGQHYYKEHNRCGPEQTVCEESGGTIKLKEGKVVCCPNNYCSQSPSPATSMEGYLASEDDCSCTKSCNDIYPTLYDSTAINKPRNETYVNEHGNPDPPLNCGFECKYATNGYCTLDDPKISWQGTTPTDNKLLCGKTNYENPKDNLNGLCFSSNDYVECNSDHLICPKNGCGDGTDSCCPPSGSDTCKTAQCAAGTVYPCYKDDSDACGNDHHCMSLNDDSDLQSRRFNDNIGYCVKNNINPPSAGTSSAIEIEKCIDKKQIGEYNSTTYALCPSSTVGYNLDLVKLCAPPPATPCATGSFCANNWQPITDWAVCAQPGAPSAGKFLCCDDKHKVLVDPVGSICPPAPGGGGHNTIALKGKCAYCCPKPTDGSECLNTTTWGYSRAALGLPKATGAPAAVLCSETQDSQCQYMNGSPTLLNDALRSHAGLSPAAKTPSNATSLFCDAPSGYCKAHCGALETVENEQFITPMIAYDNQQNHSSMCVLKDQITCGTVQTPITYTPTNFTYDEKHDSPVCTENGTTLLWRNVDEAASKTQDISINLTEDTKQCTSNNACLKITEHLAPYFGGVYGVSNTGDTCTMTADCLSPEFKTPFSSGKEFIPWSKLTAEEYANHLPTPKTFVVLKGNNKCPTPVPTGYVPAQIQRGGVCRNQSANILKDFRLLSDGRYCENGVTVGGADCYNPTDS